MVFFVVHKCSGNKGVSQIKLTQRQMITLSNKLTRHAKNNCANFVHDECALYGKCKIPIYFASLSTDDYYRCDYFEKAVLPSEPTLLDEYMNRYNEKSDMNMKQCVECNDDYIANSNAQKYCSRCSTEIKRERDRKRMNEKRINEALSRK